MTNTTTKEQRRHQVTQMNANFAIEDMRPDADDMAIQASYVAGTASLTDLLQHARDFATGEAKGKRGDDHSSTTVEQLVDSFFERLAAGELGSEAATPNEAVEQQKAAHFVDEESAVRYEQERRRKAVDFARASIGLEGYKVSAAASQLAERFVAGEIDLAEWMNTNPEDVEGAPT